MQIVAPTAGYATADGGRQPETHRPQALAIEDADTTGHAKCLHRHLAGRAGTARHEQVAIAHGVGEHVQQDIVAHAARNIPIFFQDDRITGLPLPATRPPVCARIGGDRLAL